MSVSKAYLQELSTAYKRLIAAEEPLAEWPSLRTGLEPWPHKVWTALGPPFEPSMVNLMLPKAKVIAELIVVDLISAEPSAARPALSAALAAVERLMVHGGGAARKVAQAVLESLLVGLEALPDGCADQFVRFLDRLVELDREKLRQRQPTKRRFTPPQTLYDLLNAAMYAEVVRFCKAREVRPIQRAHEGLVERIKKPVISVASRKGGTGKTVFLMAIATWFAQHEPHSRVCVLDLDLSGPVWQHVLFPERNRPERFLDDLLDLEQPTDDFEFGAPDEGNVLSCVDEAASPFGADGLIGHLGVRDVPGVRRILSHAADRSRRKFYPFLLRVVAVLSRDYDLILIDNAPGFESIPFCSHALASSTPSGGTFVISTPTLHDLGGTFLELANARLTMDFKRPPFWVVNKVTERSLAFLSGDHTAYHVAKCLRAYDGVLPEAPLVERVLRPTNVASIAGLWQTIQLDRGLLDFGCLDAEGRHCIPDLSRLRFTEEVASAVRQVL
ncbi:P-loop NTPase [Planctomycetota bacterium]